MDGGGVLPTVVGGGVVVTNVFEADVGLLPVSEQVTPFNLQVSASPTANGQQLGILWKNLQDLVALCQAVPKNLILRVASTQVPHYSTFI